MDPVSNQPSQPESLISPDPTDVSSTNTPAKGGLLAGILSGLGFVFNWFIIPIGIVLVLHFFVFQAFHVVGHSMDPTLHEADYLIISKVDASVARLTHPADRTGAYIPKREQIVVFKFPLRPSIVFVKRVIGLPGDRVVVGDGKVTVFNAAHPNGFNPDASHDVTDPVTLGSVDETVPDGQVFVLGDNRTPGGSYDSRDWGLLPSSDIIGTAFLRLLPLNKFQVLSALVPKF